jgi:hypothetical protein
MRRGSLAIAPRLPHVAVVSSMPRNAVGERADCTITVRWLWESWFFGFYRCFRICKLHKQKRLWSSTPAASTILAIRLESALTGVTSPARQGDECTHSFQDLQRSPAKLRSASSRPRPFKKLGNELSELGGI